MITPPIGSTHPRGNALVIQIIAGPTAWSLPVAVLAATLIVYFVRRSRGGSFTDPGRPPER